MNAPNYKTFDEQHLPNDDLAREHARLAMLAPHLKGWETVTIYHHESGGRSRGRLLGTWVSREDGLMWEGGTASATSLAGARS